MLDYAVNIVGKRTMMLTSLRMSFLKWLFVTTSWSRQKRNKRKMRKRKRKPIMKWLRGRQKLLNPPDVVTTLLFLQWM